MECNKLLTSSHNFDCRAWVLDGKSIARKVTRTSSSSESINHLGASRECPNCHYEIDNSDVMNEWPGLPAGVKFAPTDAELVEHLAAKCGIGNSSPHLLLDDFIPTLDGDTGICYAHPENLPGAKKDGSSFHFFHRTMNAYATGHRKRRKIQTEHASAEERVRWHKTGKTKPVLQNGVQKGCKKIMVLYKSSKRGSKPDKADWIMHQFHLGTDEHEMAGEYVVSRIFYQLPKGHTQRNDVITVPTMMMMHNATTPRTPNLNPPNRPRPEKSIAYDDVADDTITDSSVQVWLHLSASCSIDMQITKCLPFFQFGESQPVENSDHLSKIDDSLVCKEIFSSSSLFPNNSGLNLVSSYTTMNCNTCGDNGNNNPDCRISDLDNIELDSPPDFQLSDLQFGSQDSILSWLDKI
ncbi:SUPPRESSOR OF GAMMA RESPONSE 1 [Linum perenne]